MILVATIYFAVWAQLCEQISATKVGEDRSIENSRAWGQPAVR
jgi:hypothetical protein